MKNMTAEIPAEIRDLYRTVKQNPDSGIALFSDKYTDKEIIQMLLSLESEVELKEIQSGSADPGRLADAVQKLRRDNFYITTGQKTTDEIAKSLYRLKKKYNVETAYFYCDALKDGFISILTLAAVIGVNVAFPEDEYVVL
ncbi:MAG: hypothetical protein V8T90_05335 [Victivallales bacterium]